MVACIPRSCALSDGSRRRLYQPVQSSHTLVRARATDFESVVRSTGRRCRHLLVVAHRNAPGIVRAPRIIAGDLTQASLQMLRPSLAIRLPSSLFGRELELCAVIPSARNTSQGRTKGRSLRDFPSFLLRVPTTSPGCSRLLAKCETHPEGGTLSTFQPTSKPLLVLGFT